MRGKRASVLLPCMQVTVSLGAHLLWRSLPRKPTTVQSQIELSAFSCLMKEKEVIRSGEVPHDVEISQFEGRKDTGRPRTLKCPSGGTSLRASMASYSYFNRALSKTMVFGNSS